MEMNSILELLKDFSNKIKNDNVENFIYQEIFNTLNTKML